MVLRRRTLGISVVGWFDFEEGLFEFRVGGIRISRNGCLFCFGYFAINII